MLRQPRRGDVDNVQRVQPIPRRHVRFNAVVTVYRLPPDDRRSPWMRAALNRRRFERRIRETENILRPVLLTKLVEQLSGTFTNVSVNDS